MTSSVQLLALDVAEPAALGAVLAAAEDLLPVVQLLLREGRLLNEDVVRLRPLVELLAGAVRDYDVAWSVADGRPASRAWWQLAQRLADATPALPLPPVPLAEAA